jgi:hypothetical protein
LFHGVSLLLLPGQPRVLLLAPLVAAVVQMGLSLLRYT